jgi:hypothetical protein
VVAVVVPEQVAAAAALERIVTLVTLALAGKHLTTPAEHTAMAARQAPTALLDRLLA